ncbi:MAG: galactose-1-phosphate uridylyltransferase [Candidatus Pacebacteria bacterium]|nr:galactose-1-phosphate uridylyltransferase [Candidatus Paceibacterota bacterium]
MSQKSKSFSELRCDAVSGDWVVVAAGRGKRPDQFGLKRDVSSSTAKTGCPFCVFFDRSLPKGSGIVVVDNKYPAFSPDAGLGKAFGQGFFKKKPALGFHEVVVLKKHDIQLADVSLDELKELIGVYQERYLILSAKKGIKYVFIFHNQGPLAGASITHPHSQIIANNVVDFGFLRPLKASQAFYAKNKKCLYCQVVKAEMKNKERIVDENKSFVALCPFASKISFEVMIFPKNHSPYFERISEEEKADLADILKSVLIKIKKGVGDPDYNFFIRTSPCDKASYPYFHWHLDILPKTAIYAGFELGANMEIITMAPEQAAEYLRKIKV